jgi:diguanylate cyclase (GGDEF)-like protein/PAS domain S-box-containing protein
MRIQTRLFLLLTVLVSSGIAAGFLHQKQEDQRSQIVQENIRQDFNQKSEKILQLKGKSLETFAFDYTYWDEMIDFVYTQDPKWAYDNLVTATSSYQFNHIWIYNLKQELVFSMSEPEGEQNLSTYFDKKQLSNLFSHIHQQRFCHFFLNTEQGWLEVRAATIHPSNDTTRQTLPRGYFFTARLWSKQYLDDLKTLLNAKVYIQNLNASKGSELILNDNQISASQTLTNWEEKPIAEVVLVSNSILLEELDRFRGQDFRSAILVGSIIFISLSGFLVIWINLPLNLLSKSLASGDISLVKRLEKSQTEFGYLAHLIISFFAQKEELLAEIKERQQVEAALRQTQERYALVAEGVHDGVWDWDLLTNQVYFSPRWKSMLGYTDQEISDQPNEWLHRIHPEDFEQVKDNLEQHLLGKTTDFESEYRIQLKDGSYRWMLSRGKAVRDRGGQPYRIAGSQTDLTNRKALYDPLTGLANRTLFIDRLSQTIENKKRHPEKLFAILFLDLDRFKWINDSLGHSAGDQLLIEIAHRLKACIRPSDTVARLGGDEFTILLYPIEQAAEATAIADRIQQNLSQGFELNGHEIYAAASIGIVVSDNQHEKPEDLLRNADTAMYRAKALGKACYQIFDQAMHASALRRLRLASDLHHALDRQQLCVYYQPVVSVSTQQLKGFEALLRWQHPEDGMIPPDEFIPMAEETGLILPIGEWVLRAACCQLAWWQQQFPELPFLSVSVNLSSHQLAQPNLAEKIAAILQETGLRPEHLKLEMTETTIMRNSLSAASIFEQLKTLGVKLKIDDFGTGYCSLSYLHKFSFDALKIDRSFVSQITTSEKDAEIVKTTISLAHNLGIYVVAEGVETSEQLEYLKSLNCEYAQGYFFDRPLEPKQAETWLNQQVLT